MAPRVVRRHIARNGVFSQVRSKTVKEIGRLFQGFCNSGGQRERRERMTPQTARAAVVASALFAFAGAAFAIYAWLGSSGVPARAQTPSPLGTADALQAAFVTVAERVRPAVVHIGTVQVARARRPPAMPGPFADDPVFKDFFDQFFGRGGGPGRREEFQQPGLGSGVIIDKRGYVLTNFHVIKGADGVTVKLSSKQELRGRIIGTDTK